MKWTMQLDGVRIIPETDDDVRLLKELESRLPLKAATDDNQKTNDEVVLEFT